MIAADDGFERRLTYAAWIAALLLFVPLLIPLLGGRVFAIDDLSALHAPLRYVYQSALTAGHSVLWTSQLFGGFYVHAEGEVGALHPLHLVLYAALPLAIAFNLELILSYVFAFAGMYLFLKHIGFSPPSRVVGAIAFAFSGFMLLHLPHMNMVAVLAHVPWLLLAMELSVSPLPSTRWKGLVAISLLLGSASLLGHPQSVWMSGLICFLYALLCARAPILQLMPVALAFVAGLMLAGVQLVPSFDLLTSSVRKSVATSFALSYSLHPLNIMQLFSPYLLMNRAYAPPDERFIHEFGVYSSVLATLALTWTIVRWGKQPFARLTVFGSALSILGLLLALGHYGHLYEWLTMLPVLGQFRAPARHIVLIHFGLAVLVAVLLEDLLRVCATESKSSIQHKWMWIPLVISACAAVVGRWRPQLWATFPNQPLNSDGMLIGVMFFVLVTLLVIEGAKGARPALMWLPCVLALDLGIWGYSYIFAGGTRTIDDLAGLVAPPASERGATVHESSRLPKMNVLLFHDLRVLRPLVALAPQRMLSLTTENELRVSGAEWVSTSGGWTRVPDPMPRVRIVPHWRVANDASAVSEIDIRRTAFVAEEPDVRQGVEGKATLVVDEPGHLEIDVSTAGSALLVTTEAYDRGWRAASRLHATALRTLPVNGDYLGVITSPGEYRLSLAFEPESFRTGIYTSVCGSILMVLVATLPLSNRKMTIGR